MSMRMRLPVVAFTCLVSGILFERTASAQMNMDAPAAQDSAPPQRSAMPTPPAPASPSTATQPKKKKKDVWYGWQTLLVDAGVVTIWITAIAMNSAKHTVRQWSGPVAFAGVHAYGVGPPLVHFARGNHANGFWDIGLRVGAPLVLATVGGAMGLVIERKKSGNGFSSAALGGAALGLIGGYLVAVIGDSVVLAREPAEADEQPTRAPATTTTTTTATHRQPQRIVMPFFDATPASDDRRTGITGAQVGLRGQF